MPRGLTYFGDNPFALARRRGTRFRRAAARRAQIRPRVAFRARSAGRLHARVGSLGADHPDSRAVPECGEMGWLQPGRTGPHALHRVSGNAVSAADSVAGKPRQRKQPVHGGTSPALLCIRRGHLSGEFAFHGLRENAAAAALRREPGRRGRRFCHLSYGTAAFAARRFAFIGGFRRGCPDVCFAGGRCHERDDWDACRRDGVADDGLRSRGGFRPPPRPHRSRSG